jgi:hypothetical protein
MNTVGGASELLMKSSLGKIGLRQFTPPIHCSKVHTRTAAEGLAEGGVVFDLGEVVGGQRQFGGPAGAELAAFQGVGSVPA